MTVEAARLHEGEELVLFLAVVATVGEGAEEVDRLARRYVIDFVEWYWWNRPDIRWPTFNVADSLIVVGVAMDTVQQVESQLIMRHYDGFMKKTRIKGRRG